MRLLRFAALLAVVVLLFPHAAWSARAPNTVKKSFAYKGEAARALAALLELPLDRRTVVEMELSQQTELHALPERDRALRDPKGLLPSDLGWRTSTQIHQTVTWDPAAGTLGIDGYFEDMSTALPAQGGLPWTFTSPAFAEAEVDKLPGYRSLLPKLAALPAKAMSGGMLKRTLELTLDEKEHASLELWRIQTWDSNNHPVLRSFITVGLGPPLPAPTYRTSEEDRAPRASPSTPLGSRSGGSRACGCRAGPAEGGSLWTFGGAAACIVRRRRRPAT